MTYNSTPLANQTPAASQPQMLQNFLQIQQSYDVDHVDFTSGPPNEGFHKKVTLAAAAAPGIPSNPVSVIYSSAGTASSVVQLFFRNQNSVYHLSPVKAWGMFAGASGAIVASQSFNISSVGRSFAGGYVVTMPANTVTGINYAVLVSPSRSPGGIDMMVGNYDSQTPTTFEIYTVKASAPTVTFDARQVCFCVIQI